MPKNKDQQLADDLAAIQVKLASATTTIAGLQAQITPLKAANDGLTQQNTALSAQVVSLTGEVAKFQADAISDANLTLATQLASQALPNGEVAIT